MVKKPFHFRMKNSREIIWQFFEDGTKLEIPSEMKPPLQYIQIFSSVLHIKLISALFLIASLEGYTKRVMAVNIAITYRDRVRYNLKPFLGSVCVFEMDNAH